MKETFSILEIIKQKIASVGFKLFLWGNSISEEEYWKQIYEQEKQFLESKNNPLN